jgi:hypothetical protein
VKHWHAYSYTGRTYTDAMIRQKKVPDSYPPIEIKHWLSKPRKHVVETFTEIAPMLAWLESEMTPMPPRDEEFFPLKERLEYSRQWLSLGDDVVYGYYSVGAGPWVSRALIFCPRRKMTPHEELPPPCPLDM